MAFVCTTSETDKVSSEHSEEQDETRIPMPSPPCESMSTIEPAATGPATTKPATNVRDVQTASDSTTHERGESNASPSIPVRGQSRTRPSRRAHLVVDGIPGQGSQQTGRFLIWALWSFCIFLISISLKEASLPDGTLGRPKRSVKRSAAARAALDQIRKGKFKR